jgi:hypothetical protein
MFTIQKKNGLDCPMFVCDACHQTIDVSSPDYKGALQIWDATKFTEGGYLADRIYHAHAGKCWSKVARFIENEGGSVRDMNIEGQVANLIHNTGLPA